MMAQTSVFNPTGLYGSKFRDFVVVYVELLPAQFNKSLTHISSLLKGTKGNLKLMAAINKAGLSSARDNSQEARKALESL